MACVSDLAAKHFRKSAHSTDVTFGTGQLDLPSVLREAKRIGVKWYFIEDESPVSEEQIPQSLKYLDQFGK